MTTQKQLEMKTEKELKEEFNITYSEIGQDYTLHRNGKVLVVYPTSADAKYRRDEIIKEELKKQKGEELK